MHPESSPEQHSKGVPELFAPELLRERDFSQCQSCGRLCLQGGLLGVVLESVVEDMEREVRKPTASSLLRIQRGLAMHLLPSTTRARCGVCASHAKAAADREAGWETAARRALLHADCAQTLYDLPAYRRVEESVRNDLRRNSKVRAGAKEPAVTDSTGGGAP